MSKDGMLTFYNPDTALLLKEVFGYEILPVFGDTKPGREKVAAISWRNNVHSSPNIIKNWCSHGWQIAIATGSRSRLLVLDFDNHSIYEQFKKEHPALADTHTVRTRRGYHLYYRWWGRVKTIHGNGCDLQADGAYIIARQSVIKGHRYVLTGEHGVLKEIDSRGLLQNIIDFVTTSRTSINETLASSIPVVPLLNAKATENPVATTSTGRVSTNNEDSRQSNDNTSKSIRTPSVSFFQHRYAILHKQIGRNNALFTVARLMHDCRFSQEAINNALTEIHVKAEPPAGHHVETTEKRQCESLATIKSACNRPRRVMNDQADNVHEPLPELVREYFNREKLTRVAVFFDSLFACGFAPGDMICLSQVMSVLSSSTYVIREGFKWLKSNFPPQTPRVDCASDSQMAVNTNEICIDVQKLQKVGQTKMGRPCTMIQVPTIAEICAILGIDYENNPQMAVKRPLKAEDLKSPSKYRGAMYREYIKARPGYYLNRWIQNKLGISRWTQKRYEKSQAIKSQASFKEIGQITFKNVDWLASDSFDNDEWGLFIRCEGRSYPPLRCIAISLLTRRKLVVVMKQTANYYYHESNPPLKHIREIANQATQVSPLTSALASVASTVAANSSPIPIPNESVPASSQVLVSQIPRSSICVPEDNQCKPEPTTKRKSLKERRENRQYRNPDRKYKKPLRFAYDESIARSVQRQINEVSKDNHISINNCRKLVDQHSADVVYAAMKKVLRDLEQGIPSPASCLIYRLGRRKKLKLFMMQLGIF